MSFRMIKIISKSYEKNMILHVNMTKQESNQIFKVLTDYIRATNLSSVKVITWWFCTSFHHLAGFVQLCRSNLDIYNICHLHQFKENKRCSMNVSSSAFLNSWMQIALIILCIFDWRTCFLFWKNSEILNILN